MTVCFELKMSPFEAEKLFFDNVDHLSILKYYDKIVEDHKKLEAIKGK